MADLAVTGQAEAYVSPHVDELYLRYAQAHDGEIDPRALAMHFWCRGGQDMLAASMQFSDVPSRLSSLERRIAEIRTVFEGITKGSAT